MTYRLNHLISSFIFLGNNVHHEKFKSTGTPFVAVSLKGFFKIGNNFSMHNGLSGNPIGCNEKCTFVVNSGAQMVFGNNVGISQSALICTKQINIGNNVKIGGGCAIYDTDFHSLDAAIRKTDADIKYRKSKPIFIGNNVFIGARSIILKGVNIGKNSIVGAGSVVTKNIPDNEIWAGNPAKFIRKI